LNILYSSVIIVINTVACYFDAVACTFNRMPVM